MRGDQAGMPDGFIEVLQQLDLVPARPQLGYEPWIEALLELERVGCVAPGAPEEPARCGDGLLCVGSEHGIAREHGGLGLRLPVAAHRTVHQPATVLQHCGGWVERMERL